MKNKNHKYNYVIHNNEVIAISTYAGKTVRGVAKCDPRDTFNTEDGKKLAAARCNEKISKKRLARASKKLKQAEAQLREAQAHYNKMLTYRNESHTAYMEACSSVGDLKEKI